MVKGASQEEVKATTKAGETREERGEGKREPSGLTVRVLKRLTPESWSVHDTEVG